MLHVKNIDLLHEETWSWKWRRVLAGLKAPRDSGEHKFARMEIGRIFYPSSVSSTVSVIIVLLLLLMQMGVDLPDTDIHTTDLPTEEAPPPLDEKPVLKEDQIVDPDPTELVDKNAVPVISLDDQTLEMEKSFGDDSAPELVKMQPIDFAESVRMIPDVLSGRTTRGIESAVRRNDMSGVSATAVLRALRWLKTHQAADGSWEGSGSPTAMCGLAVLCYMAHGETPSSKEFGQTVEKALRYLMYAQDSNGRFSGAGANYAYGHAIATYALAESFAMTRMQMLKEPLEKAVKVIIDGQQPGGAFDYNYAKTGRRDMSVTAWQVQALKASVLAKAEVPGLQECLYKCVDGLKSFIGGDGTFGYAGAGGSKTLTGAGILCLQFLEKAADPAVVNAFNATRDLEPGWPGRGGGTYSWYYHAQARYQNGGPLWDAWNSKMLPMLTQNQQADGHWESGSTPSASPVYDTTLCCLCLEVYYRFKPGHALVEEVKRESRTKDAKDSRISVDILL